MHIVGISGPIESGKSTFAECMVDADPTHTVQVETSTVVMELCNAFNSDLDLQPVPLDPILTTNIILPTMLQPLSNYHGSNLVLNDIKVTQADVTKNPLWYDKLFTFYADMARRPDLIGQPITPRNKSNYRSLMQWVGGYFLYRLHDPTMWFREVNNRISKLEPSIGFVAMTSPRQPVEADYVRNNMGGLVIKMDRPGIQADSNEGTEQNIERIVPDITIVNNGSISDLKILAAIVHDDIKAGSYEKSYSVY